jgi:hypothetical protein
MNGRTDFTDVKIIDQRYREAVRRGDKKWVSVHRIKPKFDADFNIFAANVAHELRAYLYYRTDNGKNARGLVRASGDLEIIHKILLTATPRTPNGKVIQLNAILERRQDPQANMRWVMAIRFNDSDDVRFVDEDPVVHESDVSSTQQKMMAQYLGHAQVVAAKMPGKAGERIRKLLSIADRLGYPRNWNLFIYNSALVFDFMNWRIKQPDEETNPNSRRRQMTATTGGRTPFGGRWAGMDWRIYPFRELALRCAKHDSIDECDAAMHNALNDADKEMEKTFQGIQKRMSDATSAPNSLSPLDIPEKNVGPMGFRFYKHFQALTKDKDSLYWNW